MVDNYLVHDRKKVPLIKGAIGGGGREAVIIPKNLIAYFQQIFYIY